MGYKPNTLITAPLRFPKGKRRVSSKYLLLCDADQDTSLQLQSAKLTSFFIPPHIQFLLFFTIHFMLSLSPCSFLVPISLPFVPFSFVLTLFFFVFCSFFLRFVACFLVCSFLVSFSLVLFFFLRFVAFFLLCPSLCSFFLPFAIFSFFGSFFPFVLLFVPVSLALLLLPLLFCFFSLRHSSIKMGQIPTTIGWTMWNRRRGTDNSICIAEPGFDPGTFGL